MTLYYVVTEVDVILIQFLGKFILQVMNFVFSQFALLMNFVFSQFALLIFRSLNIDAVTQKFSIDIKDFKKVLRLLIFLGLSLRRGIDLGP